MENREIITHSSQETETFAGEFSKEIKGGDVLCLFGELGSGKTTFIKGLAKGLGVLDRIISPTFVIVRTHEPKTHNLKHQTRLERIYHLDLYRLETKEEVQNIGLKEMFEDKDGIVLIEWAEKAQNLLPKKRIDIIFTHTDEDKRKIIITKHDGNNK